MSGGALVVALTTAWMALPGAAHETPAGVLRTRVTLAAEGASRIFDARGTRTSVAEFSADRVGTASFARGTLLLGVAYGLRPGLTVETTLPLTIGRIAREARHPLADTHIATERRTSFGTGDLGLAVMQRLIGGSRGPWLEGAVTAGLWLSVPTGRPLALVPSGSGVLEGAPRIGARARLGPVAVVAESLLRFRSGRRPHAWQGALSVATAFGSALSAAVGVRSMVALGRGAKPRKPALQEGTSLIPDATETLAGAAPGMSFLEATAGLLWAGASTRIGVEGAITLWGRHAAAAFGGRVFFERTWRVMPVSEEK